MTLPEDPAEEQTDPVDEGPAGLRADRTYLVTGGLGGLGLVTARKLVALGARHLTLVSRSGRATERPHRSSRTWPPTPRSTSYAPTSPAPRTSSAWYGTSRRARTRSAGSCTPPAPTTRS
ncbi:KR domain-containing protein [Streptomyces diastatochromogenes]|nr:KR domain-containing protein [Streptomyces diastatochromogenes]